MSHVETNTKNAIMMTRCLNLFLDNVLICRSVTYTNES